VKTHPRDIRIWQCKQYIAALVLHLKAAR